MAKSKPAAPRAAQPLTRKHLARAERERRLTRILLGAAGAVFLTVIGLVFYPLFERQFLQPGQPVAMVNGVPITTREFQKRVRYSRLQLVNQYWTLQQYAQLFGDASQFQSQISTVMASLNSSFGLGRDVLDAMIQDELIRQEAAKRGISVSAEELDQYVKDNFGFFPNGTPTSLPTSTAAPTSTLAPTTTGEPNATPTIEPTVTATATSMATATATTGPTPTETAVPSITPSPTITPTPTPYTEALFNRDYRDFLSRMQQLAGMSEADMRRIFEVELLRKKLIADWEATPEVESVHARHILFAPEDEAKAREVLARLQAGEDFIQLAAEFSTDPTNKDQGGDLGFFKRGEMVPEFEAAAFDNPVGLVPEPVKTSFGWHLIEVLDRQNETMEAAQTRAFEKWLSEQSVDTTAVQTFSYWENRVPDDPAFDPATPPTPFPTSAP